MPSPAVPQVRTYHWATKPNGIEFRGHRDRSIAIVYNEYGTASCTIGPGQEMLGVKALASAYKEKKDTLFQNRRVGIILHYVDEGSRIINMMASEGFPLADGTFEKKLDNRESSIYHFYYQSGETHGLWR